MAAIDSGRDCAGRVLWPYAWSLGGLGFIVVIVGMGLAELDTHSMGFWIILVGLAWIRLVLSVSMLFVPAPASKHPYRSHSVVLTLAIIVYLSVLTSYSVISLP